METVEGDAPKRAPVKRLKQFGKVSDYDESADSSFVKVFLIILAIAVLLVAAYIEIAKNINEKLKKSFSQTPEIAQIGLKHHDKTLFVAENPNAGYLDQIIDALTRFGHELTFFDLVTAQKAQDNLEQFNLIWTQNHPFQAVKNLMPHQRINHFPGTHFITDKLTLSTTSNLPHLLRAFRIPLDKERFLEYTREQRNKSKWIQKGSGRKITLVTAESVDLNLNGTLVQEYMSNPLLIDGKKFDIGIYVVLTSVDPLRIYVYESESLLRFCTQTYLDLATNSFNSSNLDSYVIGDNYTPIWQVPSLLRYYIGANLSMKQSLNAYLRRRNKQGAKIWRQIDETIKSVFKSKEQNISRMTQNYQNSNNYNDTSVQGSLNQFFELVRFDFIVDENLNVYLMKANMLPNLSSRHFPPNKLLYEQILNSYLSLVGLNQFARQHLSSSLLPVHYLDGRIKLPKESIKLEDGKYGLNQMISDKELSVYEELCVTDECHMNCHKLDCKVCYFCLSNQDKLHLRRAIFEQYSRWNFKRLLPSTFDEEFKLQIERSDNRRELIHSNYIHVHWFRGKCLSDQRFCSY